ncbi:hypothetical protein ATSB10_24900 [Dyella thiooxydans]|uniref:Lipoprotein n=1 Tax=Dyella thiooxydans TaxID=445710 RepID=A0A160N2T3_9GAMM|nr:DUF6491 family protein [Dyella thiooxydans]AND69944.1 hypothetical protein ATSB10_24900 [Dyella thiooxydans]
MKHLRILAWLALPMTLGACASLSGRPSDQQRRADYEAAAGPAQNSFLFYNSLWSWEPLGTDRVVVYARPKQAWLLDVPGCIDLPFTNTIGLTSNLHRVSVGFDKVLTGRGGFGIDRVQAGRSGIPCTITRIRPVDVTKLKQAEVERRPVEEKPRDSATVQPSKP